MATALPDDVRALLERPNYVHLCTLLPDGSPTSIPVWVGLEGDRILVGSGTGTQKARNVARDPRVALSVVDLENPYRTATIRGRVVEQRPDHDCAVMNVIARRYTGADFPWSGPTRIVLVIEPDSARYAELPFTHAPGR
ncbi:MAG: PPOX class F420-dependent oxidoreductase [Acidimicrobiales bacterium]|nr:PPOX class F420-dependent oxidoreductase [Acidimicrobiales bacterium]